MLVFCHLLIGTAIGLMVYRLSGVRAAVPLAALGAILPDIIDKPLGHIFLQGTLDSGRIYAHTLLFLGLVAVAGLAAWKAKGTPLLAAVALGAGSHLLLDGMWANPTTLFWPALGPFTPYHYPDYFGNAVIVELSSPLEWLFALSCVVILTALYRDKLGSRGQEAACWVRPYRGPLFFLLLAAGVVAVAALMVIPPADLMDLQNRLIAGGCAIVGGWFLLMREREVKPQTNSSETGPDLL
ncbi:MAG: metal-dependent hydrolase [Methanomassiliicoccus sp.]|nr:metal-dependent hydrolase [Methanomassiliicoccus sp.]